MISSSDFCAFLQGRVCVCVNQCVLRISLVSYTHIQKMLKPFLVFDAISPWPWMKAAFTRNTTKSGHAHARTHTERKDESKRPSFALKLSWLCASIKSAPLKLTSDIGCLRKMDLINWYKDVIYNNCSSFISTSIQDLNDSLNQTLDKLAEFAPVSFFYSSKETRFWNALLSYSDLYWNAVIQATPVAGEYFSFTV